MECNRASASATDASATSASSPQRENFTELRRSKLTQIDVLADQAAGSQKMNMTNLTILGMLAVSYVFLLLPRIQGFGVGIEMTFAVTSAVVNWQFTLVLSFAYVSLAVVGMLLMLRRPAPVTSWIFECMAVHYATQFALSAFCFVALILELGQVFPGAGASSQLTLGNLIWLQYHCRQLQLLDTAFMVLRKKFEGTSFLHVYLRVLNLWGWFIACRFVSSTDVYFPALVSSFCQACVYGLYFSASVQRFSNRSKVMSGTTLIAGINIAQYIACAMHSALAAIWGSFPPSLAVLHLFAIANGLILYTNFHSERPVNEQREAIDTQKRRVTFSFDSCGWLMVYHFGVGAWLSEHLGLKAGEAPEDVAFSGSSGGALIACVLAAGMNPRDVFEYVLEQFPACRRDPREMFPAVERALRHFAYDGANKQISGRLRILLTRVVARPPFVMGEVVEEFTDNEYAVQALRASCHVPLFAGVLPRRIGKRYYYDGLAWPSRLLVPWRGAKDDHVVRVSASGTPGSDIKIFDAPKWWGGLPPNPDVLRGIFWCGYRDAARWFANEPHSQGNCCLSMKRKRDAAEPSMRDVAAASRSSADAVSRWKAARALLKQEPTSMKDLPDQANISSLIEHAETLARRDNSRCAWIVLVAVAILLVAVAAVSTSFAESSVV